MTTSVDHDRHLHDDRCERGTGRAQVSCLCRRRAAQRAEQLPEREVAWPWLHGPVKPEVSPGDAKDRTARSGRWALR